MPVPEFPEIPEIPDIDLPPFLRPPVLPIDGKCPNSNYSVSSGGSKSFQTGGEVIPEFGPKIYYLARFLQEIA